VYINPYKILLFIKKLAFDGFYPLLVVLKKSIFVVVKKKLLFKKNLTVR